MSWVYLWIISVEKIVLGFILGCYVEWFGSFDIFIEGIVYCVLFVYIILKILKMFFLFFYLYVYVNV